MSQITEKTVHDVAHRFSSHPFAQHETALQSLIRLQPDLDPHARELLDRAVTEAYDAAIRAATGFCRRIDFRPHAERGMEAVHEWFCQLRPHAAKGYRPDIPLFPYAYAALWYIVLGMARHERRFAGVPIVIDPADDRSSPAQLAELQELKELVDYLPEGLRNTVLLRYFQGYSSKEAAAVLSASVNAVDLRIHRAILNLRAKLE
jgi:DNA-directed RNA polymerase specialized sigma24 family protein